MFEIEIPFGEREITLSPLVMGTWRLHVGPPGAVFYDDAW